MRTLRLPALSLSVALALGLAGCGDDEPAQSAPLPASSDAIEASASADLLDPAGASVGSVTVVSGGDAVTVDVLITDLPPGVHGFHLHTTGRCEPDSPDPKDPAKTGAFLSAGGHLAAEGEQHGDHGGDLPSLLVAQDGTAALSFTTDRVTLDAVLDDDGTAVMVHADPDNFANVPERYAPGGPDEATTKTGDAGGRIACAALTAEGPAPQ